MVKLGLVTDSATPRPVARPRVKVVLPVPTSPMSSRMRAVSGRLKLSCSAKVWPNSSMAASEGIFIIIYYNISQFVWLAGAKFVILRLLEMVNCAILST